MYRSLSAPVDTHLHADHIFQTDEQEYQINTKRFRLYDRATLCRLETKPQNKHFAQNLM